MESFKGAQGFFIARQNIEISLATAAWNNNIIIWRQRRERPLSGARAHLMKSVRHSRSGPALNLSSALFCVREKQVENENDEAKQNKRAAV